MDLMEYDRKLAQFAAMTKWIVEHGDPSPDQLKQYDDLRDELDRLERPPLLGAALQYVSWGWPVFPLRPQAKAPAIPAAHPVDDPLRATCHGECGRFGHGLYDATTNIDVIKRWWTYQPGCNVGLPTGHAFDVIDADMPDGPAQLEELMKMPSFPEAQGRVRTASGGLHILVEKTGRGNAARWRPGIDYRGLGGYVVAPPSVDNRGAWRWIDKPSPKIKKGI